MLRRMHAPQWSTKGFLRDRQGSVVIVVAVSMAMLVGFSALAVDMGYLYWMKNRLQATADAAATAGASQLGVNQASVKAEATTYAAKNMPTGVHGTVLTAADVVLGHWDDGTREFIPMGTTGAAGQACANPIPQETNTNCLAIDAVKVTTRRAQANGNPAPLFFAAVMGRDQTDVMAEAIAWVSIRRNGACILALHPSMDGAIEVSGTNTLTLPDCGIALHSTSVKALKIPATVDIETEFVCVPGDPGVEQSGSVTWIPDPPGDGVIIPLCAPPPDPLASLPEPSVDPCDFNDFTVPGNSEVHTLNPGVYCGGIEVSGANNNITFNPGTYIIKGGGMIFSGSGATVSGSEVMFYNTDDAGSYGNIEFPGGATTVDLSAPTSGTYAGVLFFQDRSAAPGDFFFKINGNISASLDGTIYMPDQLVEFSGNSSIELSSCGPKLIAYYIKFNGNSTTFGGGAGCASENVQMTLDLFYELVF